MPSLFLAAFGMLLASGDPADLLRMADEVAGEVESLRGWSFRHPVEKAVYSEEELRGFIQERFAEDYPGDELARNEQFLRMVGAIPDSVSLEETVTEVLLSQVGGFYNPANRTFYMIDREGTDYPPIVERVLVAHELAHALDDQMVSLDSLMTSRDRTQDGEFVVGALVEGSASEVMSRYILQAQLSGRLEARDLEALMESEMDRSRVFVEAPRYFHTLLANYTVGMYFLMEGNLAALAGAGGSGADRIDAGRNFLRAVADRPRSSEQILHPAKYWNAGTRDEPVRVDAGAFRDALAEFGYGIHHENTAGELLCAVLTTPAGEPFNLMAAALPAYWTNRAATGWGGDRFFLLENRVRSRLERIGVWITLWDTPSDRDEFVEAYAPPSGGAPAAKALLGDRGAIYVFGADEAAAAGILAALTPDRLRFERDGKAWTP